MGYDFEEILGARGAWAPRAPLDLLLLFPYYTTSGSFAQLHRLHKKAQLLVPYY